MSYLNSFIPITDHDYELPAVIEPSHVFSKIESFPEKAILVFYHEVLKKLESQGVLIRYHDIKSECGVFPVYTMNVGEEIVAVCNPGLGGPSAGGFTEELIARGVKKIIACGSCGVLDRSIIRGEVIVVNSAVRDEGFSYHYIPPSAEIDCDIDVVKSLENTLEKEKVKFITGKTWTTDAFFRETEKRVKLMKDSGCISVEMESASLIALSKFRNIKFGQILSSGDDVSGKTWDSRYSENSKSHKEKLFELAAKCVLKI